MTRSNNHYNINRDVKTVVAMVERLVPYIYEDELYGLMPEHFPKLTVGGLLMLLHRLSAIKEQLTPQQQSALQAAKDKLSSVDHEWPVAIEAKIQREFRARLKSMNRQLNEREESTNSFVVDYPVIAQKRMILQALKDGAAVYNNNTEDMTKSLNMLDNRLRQSTVSGDFTLNSTLTNAYPKDQFWFLYAIGLDTI
jgi:hypothetical protein